MNRIRILVPVAAALLGGCGGSPADQPTGTLDVGQQGTAPPRTAWYLRIETTDAKPIVEHTYPNAPIALTQDLAVGNYRVISWNRPCSDACPASGDNGLGPLSQVCGAPVTVTKGTRVSATVVINTDGTCSVRVN
ncbi:MAG TPA: hypothetical protein VGX25_06685 [Actinophytocola sp.]|uniref:hypothetical protein n=1 Tax=Actinophytocola sp. TaxID=1872138 RepID=UPI002DDCCD99|nr:hypothetical protein [Actinophytocola sp.]HEV2779074.1 hypothetical protein [Actinophytocola sp.]